jgi:hypothetical protein
MPYAFRAAAANSGHLQTAVQCTHIALGTNDAAALVLAASGDNMQHFVYKGMQLHQESRKQSAMRVHGWPNDVPLTCMAHGCVCSSHSGSW